MDLPSAEVIDALRAALKGTEHLHCSRCGLPFDDYLDDDPDWIKLIGPDGVERLKLPVEMCGVLSCRLCTDCCGHDQEEVEP